MKKFFKSVFLILPAILPLFSYAQTEKEDISTQILKNQVYICNRLSGYFSKEELLNCDSLTFGQTGDKQPYKILSFTVVHLPSPNSGTPRHYEPITGNKFNNYLKARISNATVGDVFLIVEPKILTPNGIVTLNGPVIFISK